MHLPTPPLHTLLPLLLITSTTLACSDDTPNPKPTHPTYTSSSNRTPNTTCHAFEPPPSNARVLLTPAFPHLNASTSSLRNLTHIIPVPNSTHYLTSHLHGPIHTFSSDPNTPTITQLIDLNDALDLSGPENGLVSIALHPDFPTQPHLFALYTAPNPRGGFLCRLARLQLSPDLSSIDPSSSLTILDVPQSAKTHSVNHIAFGPDNLLYISLGDDLLNVHARNNLPIDASQDLSDLRGSILRIDVSNASPQSPYTIPPDNPFVDTPNAQPEIFAMGLRNPWRFTFTPSGDLLVGDVGQDAREELNLVQAGQNYGWPFFEGNLCHSPEHCDDTTFTPPLVDYALGGPKAIVAGPLLTNSSLPILQNRALFADYISGNIWSVDLETREPFLEHEGSFPLVSFGETHSGDPLLLRFSDADDGNIYTLTPNTQPQPQTPFPKLLSETGCVDTSNPSTPLPGILPYTPNSPLWSDGSRKERFFAIPDDRRISIDDQGDFLFPPGSVLIKHFAFDDTYHETRLFMFTEESGWTGYSYRWNDEQTDAVLLESELSTTLPNGVLWTYPSRAQCLSCHTDSAGISLGLEVGQLDHTDPDQSQLPTLLKQDLFSPDSTLDTLRTLQPPLVEPFNPQHTTDERARSYLHSNCSMCHRPGSPGRAKIDLRAFIPRAQMEICDEEPKASRLWGYGPWNDQLIARPGRPDDSTLYLRTVDLGLFRMPPLSSNIAHTQATELLYTWINEMPPCTP